MNECNWLREQKQNFSTLEGSVFGNILDSLHRERVSQPASELSFKQHIKETKIIKMKYNIYKSYHVSTHWCTGQLPNFTELLTPSCDTMRRFIHKTPPPPPPKKKKLYLYALKKLPEIKWSLGPLHILALWKTYKEIKYSEPWQEINKCMRCISYWKVWLNNNNNNNNILKLF